MEIADVIGGEIFWSGYSVPKDVVVVHRLASRGDKSSQPGYGGLLVGKDMCMFEVRWLWAGETHVQHTFMGTIWWTLARY